MNVSRLVFLPMTLALALAAGSAAAQSHGAAPASIATDRPGFMFSSLTVGRGTVQFEAGLPAVTQVDGDGFDLRTTSFVGLLRVGFAEDLELRLGGPVYSLLETDFDLDDSIDDEGAGDLEVGLKWHLLDGQGARPSLALIPSVILPVGEEGFSAEEPAYLLNLAAEWTLPSGTGIAALAGIKRGELPGDTFLEETLGLCAGRTFGAWSPYGEAALVTSDLPGSPSAGYVGGGVKYLVTHDFQLDINFDRGVTDDAADWLFGFGLSGRF